jgi:hypothetical protein
MNATIPILLSNPKIMKNTFTRIGSIVLVISLVLGSCKKEKDEDNTPAPKTKTELISTGTWKFSSATANGLPVSSQLQTCQKDNILTFQANGTGNINEGASKCNSGDPDNTTFNWNFASSETVLHVDKIFFTGGANDYNIVELTETSLKGSQTIEFNGTPFTVTVSFIH